MGGNGSRKRWVEFIKWWNNNKGLYAILNGSFVVEKVDYKIAELEKLRGGK